jgi:hypothetical protein
VLDRHQLGPQAASGQEVPQRPRQLPGVRVVAVAGGQLDRREQHGMFGGEPRSCLAVARQGFGRHGWAERCEGDRVAPRIEQQGGPVCGVQVVVEQARGGGLRVLGL